MSTKIGAVNIPAPTIAIGKKDKQPKYISIENVQRRLLIITAIKLFIQSGYRTKDIAVDENYLKTSEVAQKIIDIIQNG